MKIRPLSLEDMEQVRQWRNEMPETLRTPYPLTKEQQAQYYQDVICNRQSTTRYYGFWELGPPLDKTDQFICMGGIENIQNETRIGEISLIVNPEYRGKGYGRKIVNEILGFAFNTLNLDAVWGECYMCGNVEFWCKIIKEHNAFHTQLPHRKYFNGQYYDSLYFTFLKNQYCEIKE